MGTKLLGTFKPNITEELRRQFKREGVRVSFIRRGKNFAAFSSDRRAQVILKDFSERRKSAAQLPITFTEKPNFAR